MLPLTGGHITPAAMGDLPSGHTATLGAGQPRARARPHLQGTKRQSGAVAAGDVVRDVQLPGTHLPSAHHRGLCQRDWSSDGFRLVWQGHPSQQHHPHPARGRCWSWGPGDGFVSGESSRQQERGLRQGTGTGLAPPRSQLPWLQHAAAEGEHHAPWGAPASCLGPPHAPQAPPPHPSKPLPSGASSREELKAACPVPIRILVSAPRQEAPPSLRAAPVSPGLASGKPCATGWGRG